MMGLGYLGNGVPPSSSSSNLSPLAPPFTVHRSNSKPFSNPPQYPPPPPALPYTPDYFPNQVDSIRTTTSFAPATDFRYEATSKSINPPTTNPWSLQNPNCDNNTSIDSLSYIGEPKPSYSPYVSPVIDAVNQPHYDSTSGFLSPMDELVDYTQCLSGVEYPPQWGGLWNGLSMEGKQMEIDASGGVRSEEVNVFGSFAYKNYTNQGHHAGGGACELDSLVTQGQGKYVDVFGRENLTRCQLQDKSFVSQNHTSIPTVQSSKTPILRSDPMFSESLMEPITVPWNYQKSYNNPYENQFKLFDSCKFDPAPVTKFSPVPLSIKSPVGTTPPISAQLHTVNGNDIASPSPSSSKTKEAMPNKLLTKNVSFCSGGYPTSFKATSASHASDVNVTDGFLWPVESSEAFIKSTATSSESLDSPCWKGAPPVAAHISSLFDAFEAVNPQQHLAINKLEPSSLSSHGLNLEGGIHIFPPYNESLKAAPSQEVFGSSCQNDNTCLSNQDDGFSLPSEITWDTDLPTNEHYYKSNDQAPKTSSSGSNGVLSINNIMNPRSRYDFAANESNCDSHSKPSVTKQGSAEVDSLKLKSVTSPCEEAVMYQKANGKISSPQMDVGMLVNVMHNLSELLLFHCSHDDGCETLDKQHNDTLKHVSANLDACMSMSKKKIVQMAPTQEESTTFPQIQQYTSCQHGVVSDSLHHMRNISINVFQGASARMSMEEIKEPGGDSGELGHEFIAAEQKRNNNVFDKKIEVKFAERFSSRDDTDVLSKDHHIIQDIKKVLDQDFQCEEEELESNASSLYKNLWLEAEAELCIANYRTRFDRVKKTIEVQNCNKKLSRAKDVVQNISVEEKPLGSSLKASPDVPNTSILEAAASTSKVSSPAEEANNIHLVQQRNIINSAAAVKSNMDHEDGKNFDKDDIEASVMARLQILNSRRDYNTSNTINPTEEEQQLPDVWSTVVGIEENKRTFEVAVGVPNLKDHNRTAGKRGDNGENEEFGYAHGYDESEKEFHVCVTDDPVVVRPTYYSRNNNSQISSSVWYDYDNPNSSLDWEHVLKDDFAVHN